MLCWLTHTVESAECILSLLHAPLPSSPAPVSVLLAGHIHVWLSVSV